MDTSPAPHAPLAALRELPSVDTLLKQPAVVNLSDDYPRSEVVYAIRAVLEERRATLRAGGQADCDLPALALDIRQRLYERSQPHLRKVINATGVVLHTGLGRAPLAQEALDAIVETAGSYCNLELDLATGQRGNRHDHVRDLLRELCEVEDALVVNNNAAATFLALNTLSAGREAVISRGQLVEIGGSYRLPDIMAAAQCRMVEVGTTNRTRLADYERAVHENTALLLRVHTSNYRIQGFTEETPLADLVALARRHNLVVVDDLGSGLLTHDLPWGLGATTAGAAPPIPVTANTPPSTPTMADGAEEGDPAATTVAADSGAENGTAGPRTWDEPTVRESVSAGADLTLFSGDKLLGGPQAGIIVGRADLIAAIHKNPLARAFRPGKLTLAALEATLRLYRDPASVVRRIPALALLARTANELEQAARELAQAISADAPGVEVSGHSDFSEAGGGTLPLHPFPTWVVVVRPQRHTAVELAAALRRRDVPIACRIRDEALVFDPRALETGEAEQIAAALAEVLHELDGA
jgi:L-seryl-tRNA(Ser) seleniumtransferase